MFDKIQVEVHKDEAYCIKSKLNYSKTIFWLNVLFKTEIKKNELV